MSNNKAREINNPIIKQLLDETTAEELAKIDTEMTNNKQQTAVELFIEQLEEKGNLRETPSIRNIQLNIDTSDYMELKVQAKEMEKERIIKAWKAGDGKYDKVADKLSEQYYEQTYGGGEQ